MTELCDLDLLEAARGLAVGDFTSRELVEACLARVGSLQPALNAFIDVRGERALEAADRSDAARRTGRTRGPLEGLPLAHKDMFFREGEISTCGSKILAGHKAETTATVLRRLDRVGALDLGTLNMSEFALGPTGQNVHYGPCRNPHDTDRISRGSSSGAGAAVAAGMAFGALGSDTAGSVRLPAALCGAVGLKPTHGRVSRYGAMPLSESLDTFGVVARTVGDCAAIFDVLAGRDDLDPASSGLAHCPCTPAATPGELSGVRIGRPLDYYFDGVHAEVGQVVDGAITCLADLRAECVDLPFPYHEPVADAATIILTSEAAALHAPWIEQRPQDYGRAVRERIQTGFGHAAAEYIQILSDRKDRIERVSDHVFGRCDVFVTPVLDMPAPTIAETDTEGGPESLALISSLNRKTRTINYLGFPAIVVRAGKDARGMPVAIQIVARPFAERLLFRVAAAFEHARDANTGI